MQTIISADPAFLYKYLDSDALSHLGYFSHDTRLTTIWNTENFMDLADDVFNYLHEKNRNAVDWKRQVSVSVLLASEKSQPETIAKQDLWIDHIIDIIWMRNGWLICFLR